jgi:vacuolar-type H+-ATPase subunit F/Vma7
VSSCIRNEELNTIELEAAFPNSNLNASEDSIISIAKIAPEVAEIIKHYTGNPILPLRIGDEFGELDSSSFTGIYSRLESKNGHPVLTEIVKEVSNSNYSIICYYDDNNKPYIAAINDRNTLNFIELRGTQAFNYDMESEDIHRKLEQWKSEYDLRLIGVARDYIDIEFATPPEHTDEFKKMVGDFCPDALDWYNAYDNVLLMDESGTYLNLWWD